MQRSTRLQRELSLLATEPPPGITCWPDVDSVGLIAQIIGGENTPYDKGVFTLEVFVPERYPFEPPQIRFLTPIYHPNIDSAGRICLDILKLPPKGSWRPSLSIATVLASIRLLMAEPNPDDPLMADVSSEFKHNKPVFLENARRWTEKHARQRRKADEEEASGHPLAATDEEEASGHPSAAADEEEASGHPSAAADEEAGDPAQKRKAEQLEGQEKRFRPDV